jgi:RNA polymerase sigma-70 factor (ECF subfamily)
MIPDETLVANCIRGDEDSFRVLVDRYRPRLYAVAYGMLHDGDQASDAVQDVFLKAYGSLHDYRGRGVFGAWIRRILVNHCLTLLRQRHRFLSLEDLDQDLVSRDRSPEEHAVEQSETDRIRAAMGRLPAHYRSALVLRCVEGLSYREIAQLLGVPDSTIETWIHRGRLKMRTLLQPGVNGEGLTRLACLYPVVLGDYRNDVC